MLSLGRPDVLISGHRHLRRVPAATL